MSEKSRRLFWALEYVNGRQWIGRFNDYWTRGDIGAAQLFDALEVAESALQALLQEAKDRVSKSEATWPAQFWFDIHGGLVRVVEVERILQRSDPHPSSGAVDPSADVRES